MEICRVWTCVDPPTCSQTMLLTSLVRRYTWMGYISNALVTTVCVCVGGGGGGGGGGAFGITSSSTVSCISCCTISGYPFLRHVLPEACQVRPIWSLSDPNLFQAPLTAVQWNPVVEDERLPSSGRKMVRLTQYTLHLL